MCGIAGASINPAENIDTSKLATALLLGIEERGQHATGVAWTGAEPTDTWILKDAVPASDFVTSAHVPHDAATFIAHTRWATKGAVQNNDNNHPIDVNGIVGIHNGCIWNDDDIFEALGTDKRIAQVDSEAIFAALLHTGLPPVEVLPTLKGSAAIAWYDLSDPHVLHLSRVSSSPLVLGHTEGGSLIFASTERAIKQAALAADVLLSHTYAVPEGWYLQVRDGGTISSEQFTTQGSRTLTDVERRALNVA